LLFDSCQFKKDFDFEPVIFFKSRIALPSNRIRLLNQVQERKITNYVKIHILFKNAYFSMFVIAVKQMRENRKKKWKILRTKFVLTTFSTEVNATVQ